jgi:hypothetical protein
MNDFPLFPPLPSCCPSFPQGPAPAVVHPAGHDPNDIGPPTMPATADDQPSHHLPAGFRLCTFEVGDDGHLLFCDGELSRDTPPKVPKNLTLALAHESFQVRGRARLSVRSSHGVPLYACA